MDHPTGAIALWWLFLDWAYNRDRYRDWKARLGGRIRRGVTSAWRGIECAAAWTWRAIVIMATSPRSGAKRAAKGTKDGIADAVRAAATSLSKIIRRRPEVVVPQPFGPLQSDMDMESEIRESEAAFGDINIKKAKHKPAEFDDARSYSTVAPSYHTQDGARAPSYASKDPHPPPSSSAPTYCSGDGPYLASRPSSPPGSIYSEVESLGEVPDLVTRGVVPQRPPRSVYRLSRMGVPTFTSPYQGPSYLTTTQLLGLTRATVPESDDIASSVADSGAPLIACRGHDSV
ncbi:uncharacterized protein LOC62_06G007824 [Vanrija pseudolonga]|uniref:Uncharacterized protein n=1 Tax=Vanrija pseudolonga TaxID=143232 RepID=A0AAF0YCP8_9TREE|nr:hypothetical protein LOC62_06G007824 [Vanrija pseudolonga]